MRNQSIRRRRIAFGLFTLISSAVAPALARPGAESPDDLTPLLEPIRAKHGVPALAAAASISASHKAGGATGVRAVGSPERVTPNDKWHIGSCAKAFTSLVIKNEILGEKMRWDSTLAEIFPDLSDEFDPACRKITIEQLLTHRAGLPEDRVPDAIFAKLRTLAGPMAEQRKKLVAWSLQDPPKNPPGTKFEYSNRGYSIAAAALEKATGKSWEDNIREFCKDAHISSVGFGAPGSTDSIDQPRGHRRDPKGEYVALEPGPFADNPACMAPAGGLHISLSDWARFGTAMGMLASAMDTPAETPYLQNLKNNEKRLFTPPPGSDYAMGWVVHEDKRLGRVFEHAGSNTLWFAMIKIAPESGLVLVAATNCGDPAGQKAVAEAMNALVDKYAAKK